MVAREICGCIFLSDCNTTARLVSQICGELEIPRILIPLETASEKDREFYLLDGMVTVAPLADVVLAENDQMRNAFVQRGYPAERVDVVGSALTTSGSASIGKSLKTFPKSGFEAYPETLDRLWKKLPIDLAVIPSHPNTLATTQAYLRELLGANHVLGNEYIKPIQNVVYGADLFLQWGLKTGKTKTALRKTARGLKRPLILLEDGFIRSVGIGLSGTPGLSIIMDDITAYYDCTAVSRLELHLESGSDLSDDETRRARSAIDRIVEKRVSKYNHAPDLKLEIGRPDARKILIVDQRKGDQSILSGGANEDTFIQMLDHAVADARGRDIIVKLHPDAITGGKDCHYTLDLMETYRARYPHIHTIATDVNPFSLFDLVQDVYVVSSGMGFEALMAGKNVHCFGLPFYSGWGVTTDHQTLPRRTRRRSIEDLFHFAYIVMSRYYHPVRKQAVEVEELVDYIAEARGW